MAQHLIVERDLIFEQNAQHGANVKGRFSFDNKIVYYDDFQGKAVDATNDYTSAGQANGAVSITTPHCMTITTEGNDEDEWAVAMGIEFYGQYNACMEVRARNDTIAGLAHFIGFSDVQAETGKIAFNMDSGADTLTSTCSNGAGFLQDDHAVTKSIRAVSVKGDADGAIIDTGHDDSDASWTTYRVEFQDDGTITNALFYMNTSGKEIDPISDLVGMEIDAVTRGTALCPIIAVINRGDAAITFDVDYIKVWQDRS